MTDLDRLLELHTNHTYEGTDDYKEFISLKAKIEGKIEKADISHWMIDKQTENIKDLESQVAKSNENSDYWQNKTTDKINEIVKLKEELEDYESLIIKDNEMRLYTRKLESTLDEIKHHIGNMPKVKEILAKHEDKK